jgi:hypothetical protein
MTEDQISRLGPAFTEFLSGFRECFPRLPTFKHLGTYCRGLLSDLTRKSVEPIALSAGTAVRTLQEFLTHHAWDHGAMRDAMQRRIIRDHLPGIRNGDTAHFGIRNGDTAHFGIRNGENPKWGESEMGRIRNGENPKWGHCSFLIRCRAGRSRQTLRVRCLPGSTTKDDCSCCSV